MIWSLAREQLRAQRRYVAWMGAVIAFTVGIAAYGLLVTFATATAANNVDQMLGGDRENVALIDVRADVAPASGAETNFMTPGEYRMAIDEAMARGASPFALTMVPGGLPSRDVATYYGPWNPVVAVEGDVDWGSLVVDGRPPQAGEIVVAKDYARDYGLDLGDELQLSVGQFDDLGDIDGARPVGPSLTIVGLGRSGASLGPLEITMPGAYISPTDTVAVVEDSAAVWDSVDESAAWDSAIFTVEVTWNGSIPAFDRKATSPAYVPGGFGSEGGQNTILWVAAVGVGTLVIGTIAMAFAVGRAQAQVRSKWVATARALGATRSRIVGATLAESTAMGALAGVAGLAFGTIIAAGHGTLVRMRSPHSVYSDFVTFSWDVAILAVLFGVILALIVGAIPAFWSTRVAPVAALKPVTELSEAEISRRVAVRPLIIAWAVATAVAVLTVALEASGALVVAQIVAFVAMAVLSIVLMQEAVRWSLPRAGRRLANSSKLPFMLAGDIITAHSRQATIPAFIVALATAALIAIYVPLLAANASEAAYERGFESLPATSVMGITAKFGLPAVGVFVLVALLCIAIAASSGTLTAREAATREALGATRRDGRMGAGIAYAAGQAHGLAVGIIAGSFFGAWLLSANSPGDGWPIPWFAAVLVPLALMLILGAVISAVAAAIAGTLTPTAAPIARLEAVA